MVDIFLFFFEREKERQGWDERWQWVSHGSEFRVAC